MSAANKISKSAKLLSVILGAMLMSFMWRARGTNGFGAFWGLVCVGSMFSLLIFAFYGNRAKMKSELIPMGALFMGITVPAWGCAINMPAGIVTSIAPFSGQSAEDISVISQVSGLFMLLMLGFALICLYSIYVGSLFSDKEYKIKHYLVIIAVFFASAYIAKATFSHIILRNMIPELARGFKQGLEDCGIDLYWREAYLKHFDNISWAKNIPYGRYYFECIEHISYMFAALMTLFTVFIVFRDKITGFIAFAINVVSAFAITVSDFFNINTAETSFIAKLNLPWFIKIQSWSLWEYFTGFFIGFGIMFIIALVPDKYTAGRKYRSEPYIENKYLRFIFNYLLFVFAYAIVPARAVSLRLARNLSEYNLTPKEDLIGIIATALISFIVAIVLFTVFKKNILNKNLPVPFRVKPADFARDNILRFIAYYGLVYFFTGDALLVRYIYRGINNPSAFTKLLTEGDYTSLIFMLASFILFVLIFTPVKKRVLSHR